MKVPHRYDRVAEAVAPILWPGAFVLEVGCGKGGLARRLAPDVGRYVGVDRSDDAVREARRLSRHDFRPEDNLRFVRLDHRALHRLGLQFDVAFCLNVGAAATDPEVLAHMSGVLEPGGWLGVFVDAPSPLRAQAYAAGIESTLDALALECVTGKVDGCFGHWSARKAKPA